MELGNIVNGFQVCNMQTSLELKGTMYQLMHTSGAIVYYLDNRAENHVFSIAFRTLPEDHSGVFHILEHSVLCGSEKYPVKEPFVQLLKGSMNTFMNALTFPDKTVFPVSSRNIKDFYNLVSVYLDAVFCPRVIHDPRIFQQEGWHIELDESGNPSYKGVVLNEMKGAMSQLNEIVNRGIKAKMYPDTCYGFHSGGTPEEITELTYEACVQMYQRYYHPSNCIIYLEGSFPLKPVLRLMNQYMSRFDLRSSVPEIPFQKPVGGVFSQFYELAEGVPEKNRVQLTYGRILGTWKDRLKCMAALVLCDILAGSNDAPLTSKILKTGLAQDVSIRINAAKLQFDVTCTFHNIHDGCADDLIKSLRDTAEALYVNGIDREELIASINQMEFSDRQMEEPQGIARAIQILNSTLYGGDPLLYLENDDIYESLRSMVDTHDFEDLLFDMFLGDTPYVLVQTIPSFSLGQEQRAYEHKKLLSVIGSWGEEEKNKAREHQNQLLNWQHMPDSAEALQTIPRLHLEDIGSMPNPAETIEYNVHDVPVLFHPLSTGGIMYLSMYISLSDFSLHELTVMSLLSQMLGMLPTRNHDALFLQREIKKWIGDFSVSINAYSPVHHPEKCSSCMLVQAAFLQKNYHHVIQLMHEIMSATVIDEEKTREFVTQIHEGMRQSLVGRAHSYAMYTALSHFGSVPVVNEACRGMTKWKYLNAVARQFQECFPEILRVYDKFESSLGTSRIQLSETFDSFQDCADLIDLFPPGTPSPKETVYQLDLPVRAGYCIPGQSNSAVLAYRFPGTQPFTGAMAVASHLITYGTLWNKIRVMGGAYGAGMSIRYNKTLLLYSFRDPTPEKSMALFQSISQYLRSEAANEGLEQSIIACVAAREPLQTPRDEAADADVRYLTGYSNEESKRIRNEIIHTTPSDLLQVSSLLQTVKEQGAVCVIGHEAAVKKCEGLEILPIHG